MKIEYNSTTIKTDINAPAISLGIDLTGMNHVMSILSNLYSDPTLAVLREYSTNARDAHIAAGKSTVPIEVTSPTTMLPQLTITDHGIGMDEQDIMTTYSKYGSSTKRDSNEQAGAFGIGAKSAFTIASQFTVIGTKNGVKTVVLFSLQEDNTPVFQVLDRINVSEPNGVQVNVPISKVEAMNDTIERFFYTWQPGTVLVDGEQPNCLFADPRMMKLSPRVYLCKADRAIETWRRNTEVKVVMGSVAYPAPDTDVAAVKGLVHRGAAIYFFLDMGAVDLAPSREALKETDKTKAALKLAHAEFEVALNEAESNAIKSTSSKVQHAFLCQEWGDLKGVELQRRSTSWEAQAARWGLAIMRSTSIPNLGTLPMMMLKNKRGDITLTPEYVDKYIFVTGCDTLRKMGLVANRGEKWAHEQRGIEHARVIAVNRSSLSHEWIRIGPGLVPPYGFPAIDYKDFKEEAAAIFKRQTNRYGQPLASSGPTLYCWRIGSGPRQEDTVETIKKVAAGKKIVLCHESYNFLNLDDSYVQVGLSGRQQYDVLEKRFPGSLTRAEVYKKLQEEKFAALSEWDKECMAYSRAVPTDLNQILTLVTAKDPINQKIRALLFKKDHLPTLSVDMKQAPLTEKMLEDANNEVASVQKDYPLLAHLAYYGLSRDADAIKDLVKYLA